MYGLPDNVRMSLAQQAANLLTTNSTITHLDFNEFSRSKDAGEGGVIVSALASSNSLPTITHFRCGGNESWFSEGKESNVDLLCDVIRAMTSLKYLNLSSSYFSTEAFDKVVSAIVVNQE